ncbi:MAG: hypothetical protein SFX19_08710 [Alphaproteobacteria bacterium]|nr:hypothetical protein [Alphaproteobacteria bacterium]
MQNKPPKRPSEPVLETPDDTRHAQQENRDDAAASAKIIAEIAAAGQKAQEDWVARQEKARKPGDTGVPPRP